MTRIGEELPASHGSTSPAEISGLWSRVEDLYRSGVHPAIQVCIRHRGDVVLDRAIGHASGNAPRDDPDCAKRPITPDTPVCLFSASKAITAMVIHKLDELDFLRLDDPVCDYLPGFALHGKHRITIRHVLAHRSGVPNLPPDALDLDLLAKPERMIELLCETELQSRPGRVLAYHAVTGGFILGEVARRATGRDIRSLLREYIAEPLGLQWMNWGVDPSSVGEVALNAFTGAAVIPPLSLVLDRALGTDIEHIVDLSNDARFLTGLIPSANIVTTAREVTTFFQCMLDRGRHEGLDIFAPRTIRHATAEQSYWEMDFTLMVPLRYGLGFMLGNERVGPFGVGNPRAFGHVGLSNIFCWADPERGLSVAILTTGKPVLSPHVVPLVCLLGELGRVFERRLVE